MKFQNVIWLILMPSCIIFSLIALSASKTLRNEVYCKVDTNNGWIRGLQNHTLFENQAYFSFRGIPFAEPPIKNLRFKVLKNERKITMYFVCKIGKKKQQ